MKMYKPYLSLSKTTKNYELDVVLSSGKDQTITNIKQEEVKKNEKAYWGVIITLTAETQIVNGPENPIFSTTAKIGLDKSEAYKTIKCIVQQKVEEGECGPAADEETDIDFGDG
jgi:hypothetical protein